MEDTDGYEFDLERMKPEGAIVQGEVTEEGVTDWHGWRISDDPDGYSIHIGHIPGRKRVALYSEDDNYFKVLAYFQSEEAAQEMADWIDRMQDMMNAAAGQGLKTGRRL